MALTLYFHPLSSYCMKVLVALYENETPFERHLLDLSNETSSAPFKTLWPIGKMPVLRDEARQETVPESSVIIEYLSLHYPGRARLISPDPDVAWQTRLRDRFYDHYVHEPMQKIVGDRLRPDGAHDPHGVDSARTMLALAYRMIDQEMGQKTWAMGEAFSLADCAAAPALFYANKVAPFDGAHRSVAAYLDRLKQRPSFARALEEAQPYLRLFPKEPTSG